MKLVEQLSKKLISHGLSVVHSGNNIFMMDQELRYENGIFIVGHTERGEFISIIIKTRDESEACDTYEQLILNSSWFLASFSSNTEIKYAKTLLEENSIWYEQNNIPENDAVNGKYLRLFCYGRDIKNAKNILSHL